MYFSQLSKLCNDFPENQINKVDAYFSGLTLAARTQITISKLADAIQCDYQTSSKIIYKCVENGLLEKHFALQCPICQTLILEVKLLPELLEISPYCSVCEDVVEMDSIDLQSNIILLFSIKSENNIPFGMGQQINPSALNASAGTVVHADSLSQGVQGRLVTYEDLYSPSEKMYDELKPMIETAKAPHQTTTEHGASLEQLVEKLFSCCVMFKATVKQRTETNQIDVMIRVKGLFELGLFKKIGCCFYIECKNEKTTPSVDYLLKLRSILHDAGMCFGIFVSREKEPKTFRENANHIYLKDGIIIIRVCLDEIKSLIFNRSNLLELLEKKAIEVETNAEKSLGLDGLQLYDI